MDIKEQLKILPDKPGVYLMKNIDGEIIYIGKANSLRNRVRQYFQSNNSQPPKVKSMITHIHSIEYIVTDSELEALILECNLIKENKPKYNILLKDGKTYPYIKITMNEEFPRVFKTREIHKDKAKYFGPYTNTWALNETLEAIHRLYPIRDCNKNIQKMAERKEKPCLNYHIQKCLAPCSGKVDQEQYLQMIQEIILFLSGKEDQLLKNIEKKMYEASQAMEFEKAAYFRDQWKALSNIIEKQKIVSTNGIDRDVIAMAKNKEDSCVQVFCYRKGKLIQRENHVLAINCDETNQEILTSFVKQFYNDMAFIPKEILIEETLEGEKVIEEWLTGKKGSKVKMIVPQKGEKRKLVEMVKKNAAVMIEQIDKKRHKNKPEKILKELQILLQLDEVPYRIEAFDISNIKGVESVGSMVVFEGGKPNKKEYRRFKIKTVQGSNDYKSLEEIAYRRYKRGLEETARIIAQSMTFKKGSFSVFPDLIMVDGGLGQISSVEKIIHSLGLNIPVCGMVKDERHKTRGLVYRGQEIQIEKTSELFRLIVRIQNEVHRFAIEYHRSLRKKNLLDSLLEKIPGVGESRRKALMKHFGGMDKIKEASIEELMEVKEINRKVAENIYHHFRSKEE